MRLPSPPSPLEFGPGLQGRRNASGSGSGNSPLRAFTRQHSRSGVCEAPRLPARRGWPTQLRVTVAKRVLPTPYAPSRTLSKSPRDQQGAPLCNRDALLALQPRIPAILSCFGSPHVSTARSLRSRQLGYSLVPFPRLGFWLLLLAMVSSRYRVASPPCAPIYLRQIYGV